MGRDAGRWIGWSGGVLINGMILAALVLIEEPPPVVGEPPVILLELERPQRPAVMQRRAAGGARSAARAAPTQPSASTSEGASAVAAPEAPSAPAVDPAWRIEQKAIDRWRITEGVPEWRWGRYYRACKGLSSEHMTPEEKERCYGGWGGGARDKRPSPSFIGPIDETKWQDYQREPKAPSAYGKEGARKQHCRDYHRSRTPGFSERNLASTGRPPPSLREGGCF